MTPEQLATMKSFAEGHREQIMTQAEGELIDNTLTLIAALEAEQTRVKRLEEALTPSGATKAVYFGEFTFAEDEFDFDEGEYRTMKRTVPWTAIKEIMEAILARATLTEGK